ncbi:hypothetical protein [Clostridium intestinale]|uniref:Uncharacterized protein n=1 Tax=Clostridium intestinale DSM 6191 TaxID=1121320 RepID=A0A1M5ZRP7_9CLOT|nr:hypothetical protein [Clostridium intestinale]SHI26603.1 hypothetical protein SAMN02745941_03269 [Clostridium intestinale DSM 6191]
MENSYSIFFESIFKPIIILSSFFESVLLKNEKRDSQHKYVLRNIIQVGYCISISITLGSVLGLLFQIILATIYPVTRIGIHRVFLVQIILLMIMLAVLFLNHDDKTFNFPKTTFSICWFLINSKLKALFIEMSINMVFLPLTLTLLFSIFLVEFNVNSIVYIGVFVFSLLISLIILGGATKNTIKKLSRQFIMWLFLYLPVMGYTVYKINDYILNGVSVNLIVIICSEVIGLAFTLPTITDVLKNLYKESIDRDKKLIKKRSRLLRNKYNIDKYIQKLYEIKSNIIEDFKYIVRIWKSGDKLRVIKGLSISLALILCFIMYVIYQDSINTLMPQYIENISLYLFRGNRFLRDRVAILLVILIINIKFILDLYKNFKDLNLVDRIAYISRIIILASVFFMILGVTFFALNKFIYTLLNVLIIVPILVFYITEKVKKFSLIKK